MNEKQEEVLIHYIATMLKVWGSERTRDAFIADFEKAGDVE